MTPKETEEFLNGWMSGSEKAFEYNKNLYKKDFIVVYKTSDNLYEIDLSKSTCTGGPFNKEAMEKLIWSKDLKLYNSGSYQASYKFRRSDNCECGAWITNDPHCHAYYCPRYRSAY